MRGVDAGTIKDEMQIAASLRSSQGRTLCHREPLLRGDQPLIVTVGDLRSPPVLGVDAGTIKD